MDRGSDRKLMTDEYCSWDLCAKITRSNVKNCVYPQSMADFSSAQQKLSRAITHLDQFEALLGVWIDSRPITLTERSEPTSTGVSNTFFLKVLNPIPPDLDLIVGDCVHNFRSVLDHVAVSLAVDNNVSPDDPTISFPICSSPAEFKKKRRFVEGHFTPAAQRFIEELQPFQQDVHLAAWCLRELNYLDIRDKHRTLVSLRLEPTALFDMPFGPTIKYAPRLRLEDGEHVATADLPTGYTGPSPRPQISIAISAPRSNGLGSLPMPQFLRGTILPHIKETVLAEAVRQFT